MTATNCFSSFFKDLPTSIKFFPVSPVSLYLLTYFPHQHIFPIHIFWVLLLPHAFTLCLFSLKLLKRIVCISLELLKSDLCPHHYSEIDCTKISSNLLLVYSNGCFSVSFLTCRGLFLFASYRHVCWNTAVFLCNHRPS